MKALQVGLRRFDGCSGGGGLAHKGIGVLLRDGVGFHQVRIALGLDAGDIGIGLRRGQVGWACATCLSSSGVR